MRPDRVIIGADSEQAADVMHSLYAPFLRKNKRIMVMSVRDAEMTKYAANAMCLTRAVPVPALGEPWGDTRRHELDCATLEPILFT